jgi:hypothetical protein
MLENSKGGFMASDITSDGDGVSTKTWRSSRRVLAALARLDNGKRAALDELIGGVDGFFTEDAILVICKHCPEAQRQSKATAILDYWRRLGIVSSRRSEQDRASNGHRRAIYHTAGFVAPALAMLDQARIEIVQGLREG